MRAQKRHLMGRTIVAVEWNRFATGRGGPPTSDPILRLDNGTALGFVVEETEGGEYGIRIVLIPKVAKKSRP